MTDNEYILTSRIDSLVDERNMLELEIKKIKEKLKQILRERSTYHDVLKMGDGILEVINGIKTEEE